MYDVEFTEAVRRGISASSLEEAQRIARQTLEVLAEHLGGSKAKNLADRLPREVGRYLRHEQAGSGEELELDEFVDRVGERTDARDPEQAAVRARVVLRVVEEAAAAGEPEGTSSPLPQEFAPLLGEGTAESGMPGAGG